MLLFAVRFAPSRPVLSSGTRALSFDFQAMAGKLTSAKGREELGRLMKTRDEINKIVSADKVKPVDFEQYRRVLQTEGLVDAFEKCLKDVHIPAMEDKLSAQAESVFAGLLKEAAEITKKSESRVEELQGLLATLRGRKDISEISVDEALQQDPKLAAEIEKEIEDERWEVSEVEGKNKGE